MEPLLKQSVGIDISKQTFVASICYLYQTQKQKFSTTCCFENSKTGFNQLVKWVRKNASKQVELVFVMEATGVYYESLASHLHKLKFKVSVLLPNKVKNYAKCLNVKTKTDKIDSRIIARMGAEQQFPSWEPAATIYQAIRSLTRHYQELQKLRTCLLNRKEATTHSAFAEQVVAQAHENLIDFIETQIQQCVESLKQVIKQDKELEEKIERLQTIKGVGFITLAIVIGETQGFALIQNRKQLASYAGLDVREVESGTTVKGKSRISKKGNRRLRTALYLPAMVAAVRNTALKNDYQRIIKNKSNKKIGVVAVQRKLLLLIYVLWKNNQTFQQRE